MPPDPLHPEQEVAWPQALQRGPLNPPVSGCGDEVLEVDELEVAHCNGFATESVLAARPPGNSLQQGNKPEAT